MSLAVAGLVARDRARRRRYEPVNRIGPYSLARRAPRGHADDRRVSGREIRSQETSDEAGLGGMRTSGVHQPLSQLDRQG